ncbi:MAG: DUF3667 domain-containing protein [Chitinophagaceae bacterium]|nr:DUF3667 domain-containing protein [Chitinophagaceae bacterium]
MSHFKERKEKNCLNCNAEVTGRFCQVCGQENIEPKESVWHLITHFFYDITHFDGKFFSTVKYLLVRPGFLTAEYIRGKRMTYLHPIRMYVFTSAFFFLLFFSFISPHTEHSKEGLEGLKEELAIKQEQKTNLFKMQENTNDSVLKAAVTKALVKTDKEITTLKDSIQKEEHNEGDNDDKKDIRSIITAIPDIKKTIDSIKREVIKDSVKKNIDSAETADTARQNNDTVYRYRYKKNASIKKDIADKKDTADKEDSTIKKDDTIKLAHLPKTGSDDFDFDFYNDEATYLAVQKELPPAKQDGYLKRSVVMKLLRWHNQQQNGGEKTFDTIKEKFKHSFPTILFVSLPIFAFLLKLLYIRRRNFYYADHAIFTIHTYCAIFILLLLYYMFDAIGNKTGWWIFFIIKAFFVIYIMYYTYKAMRNFYEQGRFKTLVKYLFLGLLTSIVMGLLIAIFFAISAYNA